MTPERILAYWERREEAIKLEKEDPYRHGFELDTWKLADEQLKNHSEILLMGGNRAGKKFFRGQAGSSVSRREPRYYYLVLNRDIGQFDPISAGFGIQCIT